MDRATVAAGLGGALRARWRLLVAAVVVLAVVVAGALYAVHRLERSRLQDALDLVPAASLRITFTDWAAARARLHPGPLRTGAQVQRFLDRGYDADLTAASSIDESGAALATKYGFSPANAAWEAYAQSRAGAVMVLQLTDGTDMDAITSRLDRLGYERPTSGTGVWRGGADLVAGIDPTITPELQYVVVDAGKHLVLSSDTASYAARAQRVVAGDAPSASDALGGLAGKVHDSAAAFLWRGGFACEDLAMSQAAADDQQRAASLVRRAGGVEPVDGLVMSMRPDRTVDVALGFESTRQAKHDLRPRAALVVGPAVGRDGSLAETFRLTRSRTEGDAVLLTLEARERTGSAISQMSSGPVLFATC